MRPLINWFRRATLERDLDRELHYHFDHRASDLERSGLSAEEARRQATLELRGVAQIQEEVRDIWFTRWLRDFAYDLRFSLRSFLRTSSFTITAVLSLMLGIGATTAIYSLVDQVMLHALPVRQPGRLVLIDWQGDDVGTGFGSWNLMSYPICRDLDQQKQFFEGVFCRALTTVDLSTGGDPRPATAEIISGNYFPVLGVGPTLGQVLTRDDDHTPNAVAVLSYDFWRSQLGGASDVVGRKVLVNRHPLTIIGVAAPTFRGIDVGEVPSLWIPVSISTEVIPGFNSLDDRRVHWMQVLGRLNQNVTLERAEAGLQPWFKSMLHEDLSRAGFPVITAERRQRFLASSLRLTAAPQGHSSLRRQLAQPLWILFAVTAVLLGLACLNVSGLFLARASAREREIATRLALGASGGRLGRQLLVDSLLIAIVGGVLGIAAAPLAVRALIAFLPNSTNASALRAGIDPRLLLFAFLVTVVAGILSGLAPAWQSARRSLASSLRERGGTSFGGVRLRKIIVTAQVALALTLVVGAALFARSLDALMAKGPGFETASLVSFGIDAMRDGYSTPEGERMISRIDEAIRRSPITQASAVARFPLLTGGSWNHLMTIFGDQRIETDRDVNLNAVTPGFFETMGIKIVAGRNFSDQDNAPSDSLGYRSAIVSESFVERYLGGRNPLGVRISEGTGPNVEPKMEIVGVMSDFSYRGIREQSEQAYFPFYEGEHPFGTFYVKVRGTPESSFASLRALVRDADPTMPMTNLRTLDEQVNRSLNTERMLAILSGSFSTLALLLSLVGLYGVMSFVVTQRKREIGIRLALGATPLSAIWLMLRDALAMILAGIAAGLPFVWAFGRIVKSQLYQVKPWDPAVIAIAVLTLCLAGFCATLFPARRASRVNPTEALRVE
ncbi:MAG TPA: ABC transporter permease [Candidatus Binatia bacterium]|nr:ABC transporter permease [Candidatus Binatia bacterium]